MPGQTIARAQWRALDREGEDNCRLARVDRGWLLVGHARFRDGDGFAALDYVVRCDEDWHTLSADIAGTHDTRDIKLVLERNNGAWVLNGQGQPQVTGAHDIDLAFTPATNLMPLRRLQQTKGGTVKARAAWLTYPDCQLRLLDQTYANGPSLKNVSYTAQQTSFSVHLSVDPSGFITFYPGYWEGEVRHASP